MADLEGDEDKSKYCEEEGEDDGDGVLDLTDQQLTGIGLEEDVCSNLKTLIIDNNNLTKLDGLENCTQLCQFSAIHNNIVRMHNLQSLSSLTVLSLSNNCITHIDSIKDLQNLAWLDLSSNSIKGIENLPANGKLHYLDLSCNEITTITDLSKHSVLKTLLIHSNRISTLKSVSTHLPEGLAVLSLANNEIFDLNEVCYLSGLQALQQLSVSNNPCVLMTDANLGFDCRPFVWNWCPSLVVLDGFIISEKERLLGEWLYSQGKGRHYSPGEHSQLVEYLASTCPLTSSEQLRTEEDSKLSQILTQQRRYQQQIQHHPDHYQHHPHQYHNNHHQFSPVSSSGVSSPRLRESTRSTSEANTLEREPSASFSQSVDASSEYSTTQPHTQTDSLRSRQAWAAASQWYANDNRRQQSHADNLSLQDLTNDDAKSSDSLLESDSVYLPFDIPASPVVLRRPFTAPARSQQAYGRSPPAGKLPPSSTERPATASGNRSSSNKYDSLEQRIVKPLNQNLPHKPVLKPHFDIAPPPVSSNSEPVQSHPSESHHQPPTACSQDYDSNSEQTTSESESVSQNKPQQLSINSNEHPHLAKAENLMQGVDNSQTVRQSTPPSDKLNLIKSVIGTKKAERSTISSTITEKAKAAIKLRTASMRTQPPNSSTATSQAAATGAAAAATTASTMAASALLRTRAPRTSSHPTQGDGNVTRVPEHGDESSPTSQSRSIRAFNADSKQMKSRLNMERMESKKDPGSYANVRDSGFMSRPSSDAVLDTDNKAATSIQAYWRGYWAREHNTKVVSVRKEIRARRAEDHIMLLRKDLERNQKLYEEEKRLRILQMEAIKLLYQEVQALKSQRLSTPYIPNITDGHNHHPGGQGTLSPSATTLSGLSTGYGEMNRTQELEQTCIGLQSQVTQLQEALESVSSAVFRSNSLDGASFNLTDHSHNVQVMPYSDHHSNDYNDIGETNRWGSIPHSLSPFPSEEEDLYYRKVPLPGAPTRPRKLQMEHMDHTSLLLSWLPSSCSVGGGDYEDEGSKNIIGYRVFVNDQLKAFICQKTSALVKGLNPTTTYKFYIKALSGFGESFESNIIMAKLAKGQEKQHHYSESSDSANSDNSEKDDDTTENIEKHKRRNRKLRKSPRSVEKRRISSKLGGQSSSLLSQQPVEFFEGLHDGNNSNNSSIKSQDSAPILTQPKLHTHRRNRSRDLQVEGLTETTSKDSSPAAGATASNWQIRTKDNTSHSHSSKPSSPSSGSHGREGPRKLPESPSAGSSGRMERTSSMEGKERPSARMSPGQDSSVKGVLKDSPSPGSKKESPSSGSSRRESPINRRDSPGSGSCGVSPTCGSEGEQQQKHHQSKISPKPGRDPASPIRSNFDTNQSMSSTFTVVKGQSFLDSMNAIAENTLGSRPFGKGTHRDRILHSPGSGSSGGHRRVKSRDYQLRSEKSRSTPELTSVEGSRKSGSDGERDILSVQEALRLNIGKNVHHERDELKDFKSSEGGSNNLDMGDKIRGHRRKRSKDLDSKSEESKRGEGASDGQQGNDRREESSRPDDHQRKGSQEDEISANLPPSKDGRPVLDGRRRHSSGSGPSSPIIMTGERQVGEERSRMSVAEMLEQRAKGLKSSSLNSLSGRSSEDSGSRQDINKRTPSSESLPASGYKSETSKRTVSNESLLSGASSKGDGSKRTHSSDSLMSIRTDTSKRSHSNESLPGSARTDNSKRSPSNESLPESIREERESDLSPASSQISIPSQQQGISLRSHHQPYGRNQHSTSENSSSHHTPTNKDTSTTTTTSTSKYVPGPAESKLLQKLESLTKNNFTSVKETKESLMNRKHTADGSDGSGSKPPSDDERRSGRRSRNLSESDGEACASDAGSQLPPKAPSESSSGSHSDDNRHHSRRRHQRTPSDHRPATSAVTHQDTTDPRHPAHSPIIMEGGRLPNAGSSSVRRNQSFHGILPSKHQDTKTNPSSAEEISPQKPDKQISNQGQQHTGETPPPSRTRSHLRSRTPSPARTRQPIISAAHPNRRTSDNSN